QQADMLAMLENTDGIIWSIDRDYRLTASNSAFRRNVTASLGRALELGESVFQLSDGETNAEWRSLYDRALAGERVAIDVQERLAERRGTWMEYRFSPVYDADGRIVGATVLGRDITARMMAAQQIEAQLAEISHYYDTAPVGLAVLDTDLRYVRVNRLLAAMNGAPVEEHIGKTVDDVVPLVAGQLRQMAARTLATGEAFTGIEVAGGTPADPGVPHTWKMNWYPIKQSDGTIIGFNAMVEDISERKQAQARLERSEQNMAHAQRIGHLGSWDWDVPNDRLEWSDELYRIFGVDKEFVPSYASVERMIHPDDRAYDGARVHEALAAGSNAEFEIRIVRPDGTIRHIYENIEIQREATGAPTKLFGIVQDITERKQAEEALRRSEHNLNEAERISNSGSWEL
ncbi:MAG: PAS domain-containing protein, partial [Caldilinea sp.]|nr:PAS domain-containing protein [Caldilinea sp.]